MKTVGDALAARYVSLVIHRSGGAEPHRLVAYPESEELLGLADLMNGIHPEVMTGVSLARDRADTEPSQHDDVRWLWCGRASQQSA